MEDIALCSWIWLLLYKIVQSLGDLLFFVSPIKTGEILILHLGIVFEI